MNRELPASLGEDFVKYVPRTRYRSGVTKEQKKEYKPLGTNLKKSVTSTAKKLHAMSQVDDARGALMRGVGTGIQGAGQAYEWIA